MPCDGAPCPDSPNLYLVSDDVRQAVERFAGLTLRTHHLNIRNTPFRQADRVRTQSTALARAAQTGAMNVDSRSP